MNGLVITWGPWTQGPLSTCQQNRGEGVKRQEALFKGHNVYSQQIKNILAVYQHFHSFQHLYFIFATHSYAAKLASISFFFFLSGNWRQFYWWYRSYTDWNHAEGNIQQVVHANCRYIQVEEEIREKKYNTMIWTQLQEKWSSNDKISLLSK